MSGSILPASASVFRFCVNWSSGELFPSPAAPSSFSDSAPLASLPLAGSGGSLFLMPWAMKFTTSSRVTPCWCR